MPGSGRTVAAADALRAHRAPLGAVAVLRCEQLAGHGGVRRHPHLRGPDRVRGDSHQPVEMRVLVILMTETETRCEDSDDAGKRGMLLSGLVAASAARAGAPATLALAFPDATLRDMRSAAGAANDAVHRNGLALTVSGELTKNSGITIFALEVKGGRIVKRSQSDSPLPGRSAKTGIADVLSDDHYHGAVRGRTVAAADALRAIQSGSASALSPFFDAKQLGQVTVVFVAIPTCAGTDKECGETRTQPVGAMPQVFGDP